MAHLLPAALVGCAHRSLRFYCAAQPAGRLRDASHAGRAWEFAFRAHHESDIDETDSRAERQRSCSGEAGLLDRRRAATACEFGRDLATGRSSSRAGQLLITP